MTKSLLKTLFVATVIVGTLASGTAFAQAIFSETDRVLGNHTDIWRVWVPAGSTRVVVDAGGHTDIDLRVYDEATGHLLTLDEDATSYCIGDFYKPRAGFIEIHIENLGSMSNGYRLYVF